MNITIYQFLSLPYICDLLPPRQRTAPGQLHKFKVGSTLLWERYIERKRERETRDTEEETDHSDQRNREKELFLVFQFLEVILTNRR